jgi:hypothetical protein
MQVFASPCVQLSVCPQLEEGKMMERRKKIAQELSDLVVYCRPVPFDEDSKHRSPGVERGSAPHDQ